MAEAAGITYGLKNAAEGAAALATGLMYPTHPLKAILSPISSVGLPMAHQSLSIAKGRAYLFGGKTTGKDGSQVASDSDMHVVILPSSGVESADYKRMQSRDPAPGSRWGHSAAVIDERIYIFGGADAKTEKLHGDQGWMWAFDISSNTWSCLKPETNGARPPPRTKHASVASEHPRTVSKRTDEGSLPQQPPDPASVVPEPPAPDSYGTVIVAGGEDEEGKQLNDMWAFDVSSRTWSELPSPRVPSSSSPSLALVGKRLYHFARKETSYLDLTQGIFDDASGKGELGLTPLGPWSTLPSPASRPDRPHPGDRIGGSLIPVTTGQGRNYLLLVGGESASGEMLDDVWALQLKPEGMTAASFKDAARMAMKRDTGEAEWEEVRYYTAEGVLVQEGQPGRGLGGRKDCAVAKAAIVDEGSVLIWGGARDGKILGDGLMISIDR